MATDFLQVGLLFVSFWTIQTAGFALAGDVITVRRKGRPLSARKDRAIKRNTSLTS